MPDTAGEGRLNSKETFSELSLLHRCASFGRPTKTYRQQLCTKYVVWKNCQERWMKGTNGERVLEEFMQGLWWWLWYKVVQIALNLLTLDIRTYILSFLVGLFDGNQALLRTDVNTSFSGLACSCVFIYKIRPNKSSSGQHVFFIVFGLFMLFFVLSTKVFLRLFHLNWESATILSSFDRGWYFSWSFIKSKTNWLFKTHLKKCRSLPLKS